MKTGNEIDKRTVRDDLWRGVARHGRKIGLWASLGCVLFLMLVVVAKQGAEKLIDENFWGAWVFISLLFCWPAQGFGYVAGMVSGKYASKTEIATAVTTTAAVGFCLICTGMAFIFLLLRT